MGFSDNSLPGSGMGLLSGIAQGINSAASNFVTAKRDRERFELEKRKSAMTDALQQAQLRKEGFTYDPDTQTTSPTDNFKNEEALSGLNTQHKLAVQSPGTPEYTARNSLDTGLLGAAGVKVPEGMSSSDIEGNPLVVPSIHGGYQKQAAEKKAQGLIDRTTNSDTKKKTTQETKADVDFKNGLIQHNKAYQTAYNAEKGADAIVASVNDALTNQTAAQGLPTLLANYESRGQRLHTSTIDAFKNPNSALMSRIGLAISKSSTGTITPDVAKDIIGFLVSDKKSASEQKNAIIKAEAEDFKAIHGRYPSIYQPTEGVGGGNGLMKAQDKPKTVQQNGHTYQLNEATGQYE